MKIEFENKKWKLFFWINLLWIIGTIGLGIMTFQTPAPQGSSEVIETVKIMFLSLGGLGVVIPTYLSVFHSIETKQNDKNENTFQLIQRWDDPLLFEARQFTRQLKAKKSSLSDDDLIKSINENEKLKQSVILVINYFDNIRVSIIAERINVPLMREGMGEISKDMYHRLLPYVASCGEIHKRHWEDLNKLMNHS